MGVSDLQFGAGVLEEVDLAEVVGHGNHPLAVGAAESVDVCPVRALQPHAWNTAHHQHHIHSRIKGNSAWLQYTDLLSTSITAALCLKGRFMVLVVLKWD